jgi:hypothetical protein
MRHKLAKLLRRLAAWISPEYPAVQALMPIASAYVSAQEKAEYAGSIKWLIAMKAIEKKTGAKRRHINMAIDRAVLELRGD